MIFSIFNRASIVHFSLFRSKLMSDKELGVGSLDLSDLEWGVSNSLFVEMTGEELDNCSLHVLFRVNFYTGPAQSCFAVPDFSIHVEKSLYMAGEVVRGYVSLYPRDKIKLKALRVRFLGITRSNYKTKDGHADHDATIIEHVATVGGSAYTERKKYKLSPGEQHVIFFEYKIPEDVPTSIAIDKSRNKYTFRANIDQFGIDKQCSTRIFIINNDSEKDMCNMEKTVTTEKAEVTIVTNNTLISGTNHLVHVHIKNLDKVPLKSAIVFFEQRRKHLQPGGSRKYVDCVSVFGLPNDGRIEPGETYSDQINFSIPTWIRNNVRSASYLFVETFLVVQFSKGKNSLFKKVHKVKFNMNVITRVVNDPVVATDSGPEREMEVLAGGYSMNHSVIPPPNNLVGGFSSLSLDMQKEVHGFGGSVANDTSQGSSKAMISMQQQEVYPPNLKTLESIEYLPSEMPHSVLVCAAPNFRLAYPRFMPIHYGYAICTLSGHKQTLSIPLNHLKFDVDPIDFAIKKSLMDKKKYKYEGFKELM